VCAPEAPSAISWVQTQNIHGSQPLPTLQWSWWTVLLCYIVNGDAMCSKHRYNVHLLPEAVV
jgi:hypothetical protein